MRPLPIVVALAGSAWLLITACVQAASFDCTRARGKLNRVICSDAELSRMDEEVWNAYGERIKTLSAVQYAQARERHIAWRRARGLYETAVAPLLREYRVQLAWLRHPLLPLEGRYAREGPGARARIEAEVEVGNPAALDMRGFVGEQSILAWFARDGVTNAAASTSMAGQVPIAGLPPQTVRIEAGRARFNPEFAGTPASPLGECEFALEFGADRLTLTASGACGAEFSGTYVKVPRD